MGDDGTATPGIAVIVGGVLWGSDHATLTSQVGQLSGQVASTQTSLDAAQQQAAHPTLGTWNQPQSIAANSEWSVGGLPDTFTYHLKYTSDVRVTYAFLTDAEYVTFATCNTSLFHMIDPAVSKLMGCLNKLGGPFAAHGGPTNSRWGTGTAVSLDFAGAEGCGGWLEVLFPYYANQVARVQPAVSVTYNPAPAPTPPC